MDRDCKIAFIIHNVKSGIFFLILLLSQVAHAMFDNYNSLFYQLYTLLPFPVFCCTGIVCDASISPRVLVVTILIAI